MRVHRIRSLNSLPNFPNLSTHAAFYFAEQLSLHDLYRYEFSEMDQRRGGDGLGRGGLGAPS